MIDKYINLLEDYLPKLLGSSVILLIGILLTKLVVKLMRKALSLKHIDETVHKFMISVVRTTMTIIIVIIALTNLNVPMSSIVAAIGAAGLAIGLALKDSLSNVAGGFIILFSQPFKCSDYVEICGEEGYVYKISILYTTLHTLDGRTISIPNGNVAKSSVENYSSEGKRRLELAFSISYKADHKKAMALLQQLIDSEPLAMKEPEVPYVTMNGHKDSCIELLIRLWIPPDDYWSTRFKLIKQVKELFDENEIEIPFNQLDVHIDNK